MELTKENIQKVLDESINPQLELHQGGCSIVDLNADEKLLTVNLTGGCVGCPSARLTLYNGIVPILQESFPELQVELA